MLKLLQENIRTVTEAEIADFDLEKLNLHLKKFARTVSNCADIIGDCTESLQTAANMEDITESKELKVRIRDASANREIFELKVRVVSLRIRQLKHEAAIALCGDQPILPSGMDPITFGALIDCIYDRTESALIGDPKSADGKKMAKLIQAVIKSNPKLKEYIEKR